MDDTGRIFNFTKFNTSEIEVKTTKFLNGN